MKLEQVSEKNPTEQTNTTTPNKKEKIRFNVSLILSSAIITFYCIEKVLQI